MSDPNIPKAEDNFTVDVIGDTYLNMELAIPRDGDGPEYAKVTKRLRDKDELPIGVPDQNPILDTRMYEFEYPDGHKVALAANAIADNTCLIRLMMRATAMSYSRRLSTIEKMDRK
jgi:hypothetical protein